MGGSYRTARIVEIRNLFLSRLRHRVRAVEQEYRHLFVGPLAGIHGAVNTLAWFLPIDLSSLDLDNDRLSSVTVFNRQSVTPTTTETR